MSRLSAAHILDDQRVPRMRGDEPGEPAPAETEAARSPHARG